MKSAALDEAGTQARDVCFELEKVARLGGNGEVLMQLDRLPGLLLGPTGQVSDEAEIAAIAQATPQIAALLQSILSPSNQRG